VELHPSPAAAVPEHAVYLLRDLLAAAAPRSVTIVATAPLTNVALLVSLHPELVERIDRLIVMGGSAGRGNITPCAEFNVWTDPEAAQRVFTEANLDIRLMGLDITAKATLTAAHLDVLRDRSPLGALLADMVAGYRDRGPDGWAIHDAVTVATLLDPTLVQTAPVRVEVDTGTGLGRGQTVCEFVTPGDASAPRAVDRTPYSTAGSVEMGVDIDVARFQDLMLDRLARPIAR
jgi:pyrimidine-specific ribonucleoside hydrolase